MTLERHSRVLTIDSLLLRVLLLLDIPETSTLPKDQRKVQIAQGSPSCFLREFSTINSTNPSSLKTIWRTLMIKCSALQAALLQPTSWSQKLWKKKELHRRAAYPNWCTCSNNRSQTILLSPLRKLLKR